MTVTEGNLTIHVHNATTMDDIAAADGKAEIRNEIKNCPKMEKEKKMRYGLLFINHLLDPT